jgi:hypothetical protein
MLRKLLRAESMSIERQDGRRHLAVTSTVRGDLQVSLMPISNSPHLDKCDVFYGSKGVGSLYSRLTLLDARNLLHT